MSSRACRARPTTSAAGRDGQPRSRPRDPDLFGKPYCSSSRSPTGGHDRRYAVDTSKVRGLGWAPSNSFAEAIEKTVRWYRDNEAWWRKIKTGEYLDYYKRHYGGREVG
jgi:dTDP-glucose 4,6-dehydratase